jgi:hypothetical protein
MAIIEIEIVEKLSKIIKIDSASDEDALEIIRNKYSKQEIVLLPEDLQHIEFKIISTATHR